MFSGYIASFLFIILLIAGTYCFGYAVRRVSAILILLLEVIIGSLLLIPIIMYWEKTPFTELLSKPSIENWVWLGLASLFGIAGGQFFSLINIKAAGERWNSLLSPAITAATVLGSLFFFKQNISFWAGIGILITLSSVFIFITFKTEKEKQTVNRRMAVFSSIATIVCISLSILCSVKGASENTISIFHSVWLRLIIGLPVILILWILFSSPKEVKTIQLKLLLIIIGGVLIQTIFANYLWFYATFRIGIPLFQTVLATLPLWVYVVDVYLLKRTTPSRYFLLTAFLASCGIALLMC